MITKNKEGPRNTVWATRKIKIGSSNKYPCIHEWIFDKIKIQNGILGIYFADGDLPQKGDGHFCAYRYWINMRKLFKPWKRSEWRSQTHFSMGSEEPNKISMKVDEKKMEMYIGIDKWPMQMAHEIKKEGNYLMAVSFYSNKDTMSLKEYRVSRST